MKKIIQGAKAVFTINLTEKDEDTNIVTAFDLTGNTEITVCFKGGTTLIQKNRVAAIVGVVVIGVDTAGKIEATLLSTDTDTMAQAESGQIEITVTQPAGEITKWQIDDGFYVVEKLCS